MSDLHQNEEHPLRPEWFSAKEEAEIIDRVEDQLIGAFRAQFQGQASSALEAASPTSALEQQDALRPEWFSAKEEAEIIDRVEEPLIDAFRAQFQQERASETSAFASWKELLTSPWGWSGASVMAAACALFLMWGGEPQLAPLQMNDVIQTTKHAASGLQLKVKRGQRGRIVERKRWDMNIGSTTQLALVRKGRHLRTVKLKRGFVKVHVVPGQVKAFSVRSEGYEVLVKGTIFTVEKEKKWLRVEVQRGKVLLRGPNKTDIPITKGTGVRVALPDGPITPYQVTPIKPEDAKDTASQEDKKTLKRAIKEHPKQIFQEAIDLASSRRLSKKARRDRLDELEKVYYSMGQYKRAMELKLAIARLHRHQSVDAESMVLSAIHTCITKVRERKRCNQLLKQYHSTFTAGPMYQQILSEKLKKLGYPTQR